MATVTFNSKPIFYEQRIQLKRSESSLHHDTKNEAIALMTEESLQNQVSIKRRWLLGKMVFLLSLLKTRLLLMHQNPTVLFLQQSWLSYRAFRLNRCSFVLGVTTKMNGVRSMKTSFASPAPNTQHPAPTTVSIYLCTSLVIRAEDFL